MRLEELKQRIDEMNDEELLEFLEEYRIDIDELTDLETVLEKVNIRLTRRDFDRKLEAIMSKYGYSDIDEGSFEAITEAKAGTVFLYYPDGRFDTWFYVADYENNKVKLYPAKDQESEIHVF